MVHELPPDGQTESDESSTDAADDRRTAENTLVIRGDPYGVTSYQVTVSEQIEPDADSSGAPAAMSSRARAVEDAICDGRRRYAFRGSITDLRVDGPAEILVNGEPFSHEPLINAE